MSTKKHLAYDTAPVPCSTDDADFGPINDSTACEIVASRYNCGQAHLWSGEVQLSIFSKNSNDCRIDYAYVCLSGSAAMRLARQLVAIAKGDFNPSDDSTKGM